MIAYSKHCLQTHPLVLKIVIGVWGFEQLLDKGQIIKLYLVWQKVALVSQCIPSVPAQCYRGIIRYACISI